MTLVKKNVFGDHTQLTNDSILEENKSDFILTEPKVLLITQIVFGIGEQNRKALKYTWIA